MICDLDLDKILVRDDIRASWSNLKNTFLNIMESCISKAASLTYKAQPSMAKQRNCAANQKKKPPFQKSTQKW